MNLDEMDAEDWTDWSASESAWNKLDAKWRAEDEAKRKVDAKHKAQKAVAPSRPRRKAR
jgi:hypothetical protein